MRKSIGMLITLLGIIGFVAIVGVRNVQAEPLDSSQGAGKGLMERVNQLEANLAAAQATIAYLQSENAEQAERITELEVGQAVSEYVSVVDGTIFWAAPMELEEDMTIRNANLLIPQFKVDGSVIDDGKGNIVSGSRNTVYSKNSLVIGNDNELDAGTSFIHMHGTLNHSAPNPETERSVYDAFVATSRAYISGDADAIIGGQFNTIDSSVTGSADASVIMGGSQNLITAENSSVSGGSQNEVHARSSNISSGNLNRIDSGAIYSGISGGDSNRIESTAIASNIGGGKAVVQRLPNRFKAAGEVIPAP